MEHMIGYLSDKKYIYLYLDWHERAIDSRNK